MKKFLLKASVLSSLFVSFVSHQAMAEETVTMNDIYWEIKTPSSTSDGERRDAALQACRSRIQLFKDDARKLGLNVDFRNLELIGIYDDGSETRKDPLTGVRKHKAWGKALCSVIRL